MSDEQDMQLDIFNVETPTSEVPHLNCTRTKDCPAPADAHAEDCPVEQELLNDIGF